MAGASRRRRRCCGEERGLGGESDMGWTALRLAAARDQKAMVKLLLAAGADPNERSEAGPALIVAARDGYVDVAKMLLDAGADPDARGMKMLQGGESPWTPLMFAASSGSLGCVKALLEAGADPRAQDLEGSTAERLARNRENWDCAEAIGVRRLAAEEKERLGAAEEGPRAAPRRGL